MDVTAAPTVPTSNGFAHDSSNYSPEIQESHAVIVDETRTPAPADVDNSARAPVTPPKPPLPETTLDSLDDSPMDEQVASGEVTGVLDSSNTMEEEVKVNDVLIDSSPSQPAPPVESVAAASVTGDAIVERVDSPEIRTGRSDSPSPAVDVEKAEENSTPVDGERTSAERTSPDKSLPPNEDATRTLPRLRDVDPDIAALCLSGDIAAVLMAVSSRDDILAKYLEEIESHILGQWNISPCLVPWQCLKQSGTFWSRKVFALTFSNEKWAIPNWILSIGTNLKNSGKNFQKKFQNFF